MAENKSQTSDAEVIAFILSIHFTPQLHKTVPSIYFDWPLEKTTLFT